MKFENLTDTLVEDNLLNVPQIVFEVTSACNLNCYYCAYGSLYQNKEKKSGKKKMSFADARILLDYFADIWTQKNKPLLTRDIYISFYGGEPLVNFPLIREIVLYCEALHIKNIRFIYSLTTNAVLLDKYMDFLVQYNFRILISLDGNEKGQSYRVDEQNRNSFPAVIQHLEKLQTKYPNYFNEHVTFNAVMHDRNDVLTTFQFIKEKFGKDITASSLSTSNIRQDKVNEFNKIYKEIDDSLEEYFQNENRFTDLSLTNFPHLHTLLVDVFNNSGNVFKTYNDLLVDLPERRHPTGTCVPFSKKIFLTVQGEIVVCERIPQKFAVGKIEKGTICLDIPRITRFYNDYYEKITEQCKTCYNKKNCITCMFHMDAFFETGKCPEWMDEKRYGLYSRSMKKILIQYPDIYRKIMNDIILSD